MSIKGRKVLQESSPSAIPCMHSRAQMYFANARRETNHATIGPAAVTRMDITPARLTELLKRAEAMLGGY
jgi:hypothetical protein